MELKFSPKTAEFHVKNPVDGSDVFNVDGVELSCTLHLVGVDSPQFRKAMSGIAPEEYIRAVNEDDEAVENRLIAACIVGWDTENSIIPEEYTEENAFALIDNPKNHWMRDQVKAYIDNRAHFFSVNDND